MGAGGPRGTIPQGSWGRVEEGTWGHDALKTLGWGRRGVLGARCLEDPRVGVGVH